MTLVVHRIRSPDSTQCRTRTQESRATKSPCNESRMASNAYAVGMAVRVAEPSSARCSRNCAFSQGRTNRRHRWLTVQVTRHLSYQGTSDSYSRGAGGCSVGLLSGRTRHCASAECGGSLCKDEVFKAERELRICCVGPDESQRLMLYPVLRRLTRPQACRNS